jgi:hypothetical protein
MSKKTEKNPNAVNLGRLGGRARKQKLSAQRRAEIAKKAALARWSGEKKKHQLKSLQSTPQPDQ